MEIKKGGAHLDALLASFKLEQQLRRREPPPPEQPTQRSSSAVAERRPRVSTHSSPPSGLRPPLHALPEPEPVDDKAAAVPRQQQHLLKQELASAHQAVAAAEATEAEARQRQHDEQRQRVHGRVEAWREAREVEREVVRALEAASSGSEQARQRHGRRQQQEQRRSQAAQQRAQHQLYLDTEDTTHQTREPAVGARPVLPARAAANEAHREAEARRRSAEIGAAAAAAERRQRQPQYLCGGAAGAGHAGDQQERRRRTEALVRQRQARLSRATHPLLRTLGLQMGRVYIVAHRSQCPLHSVPGTLT